MFRAVVVLVPLVLGVLWGIDGIADGAYIALHNARYLASARALPSPTVEGQPLLDSPLFTALLILPAIFRIPLPWASLVLSTLGWSITTLVMESLAQKAQRPIAGVVSALLLVFNPMVVSTLGTEISWTVACACLAIKSAVEQRWTTQTLALASMLLLHCDLGTLALTTGLFLIQWKKLSRLPVAHSLTLAGVVLVWAGFAVGRITTVPVPAVAPDAWLNYINRVFAESEFYWFCLPFVALGLLTFPKNTLGMGTLWGASLFLSNTTTSWVALSTLGVYLTGSGIDELRRWFSKSFVLHLKPIPLTLSFSLVTALPLGIAQVTSLVQHITAQTVVHHKLESQAAEWLQNHSSPGATVFGTARAGYLAQRNIVWWEGNKRDTASLTQTLQALRDNPPEYCVSFESLAWDDLSRDGWFQNTYMPVAEFSSPYDTTSPLIIWERRPHFELGIEYHPLSVRLPDSRYWIGYTYEPNRFQPGETISVTLFLHEPRPSAEPLRPVAFLNVPGDRTKLAVQDVVVSRDIVFDDTHFGQVIAERLVLPTPSNLTIRAYHLSAAVSSHDPERFATIFQDESTFAIDRVALGYVVVPWRGSLDAMQPVGANVGDQITLIGYDLVGDLVPGETLNVTLYWEAHRSLADSEATYFVFVHVLDSDGQLVTQHDGAPVEGHYPIQAWIPGETVRDVHPVTFNPQLPPGTYRLQVGMYQRSTMERLPAWDKDGNELANGVIVLQSLEIR